MSMLVADLERAGLVVRYRGDDARQVVMAATDAAQRLLVEGRKRRTAWLAAQLQGKTDAELSALEKAAEVLEDVAGRPQ